jgi:2-aminoethylphosphonate dioxygenase
MKAPRAKTADSLEHAGYCVLADFFDQSTTMWLRDAVDSLGALATQAMTRPQRRDSLIVVPEARSPELVCRYEYIMASETILRDRLLNLLMPAIEDAYGQELRLFKDKVNNKYPGGGGYGPHQDIVAYRAFPPRYHVTAMITIDATTEENGCLFMADEYQAVAIDHPGIVQEEMTGRPIFKYAWGGTGNGDILPDAAAQFHWSPLRTSPPDLVLFDSYVPHRSPTNESQRPRRVMFLTFSPAADGDWYGRYYDEKRRNPSDPKFHVSTPTQRRS